MRFFINQVEVFLYIKKKSVGWWGRKDGIKKKSNFFSWLKYRHLRQEAREAVRKLTEVLEIYLQENNKIRYIYSDNEDEETHRTRTPPGNE